MERLKPVHIAWMFPLAFLIHIAEEFYAGVGLPVWYSNLFNTNLSTNTFITINATGFALVFLLALMHSLGMGSKLILVALGSLVFVNGWLHLGASLLSASYSPGTISGLLLFIPLGIITFKKVLPKLSGRDKVIGISLGILIHFLASLAAMSN